MLVVVWAAEGSDPVGAVLAPARARGPCVFGRGGPQDDDVQPRVQLVRQRPDGDVAAEPLANPSLSRQHLTMEAAGDALRIDSVHKRPFFVNGRQAISAQLAPGDTLELRGHLVMLCVQRPSRILSPAYLASAAMHTFGEADVRGIVGESPAAWALRDDIALASPRDAHVLVAGPPGVGKGLVAHALRASSPRAARPLVAVRAPELPMGPVPGQAALFGNARDRPDPGTPERPGLLGEAEGGTLAIDEIGELSPAVRTYLVRVFDEGSFQRLGEKRRRHADVRLIGITSRPVDDLPADLLARIPLRVRTPPLQERREDAPLLARQIVRAMAQRDPRVGLRYFEGWPSLAQPRITSALALALVIHDYRAHVRELTGLIERSVASSPADRLELTDAVLQAMYSRDATSSHPPSHARVRGPRT
jgi:two-component system nitrogen regulation response regulator GlnG/two-component system response regulator HydG